MLIGGESCGDDAGLGCQSLSVSYRRGQGLLLVDHFSCAPNEGTQVMRDARRVAVGLAPGASTSPVASQGFFFFYTMVFEMLFFLFYFSSVFSSKNGKKDWTVELRGKVTLG